MKHVVALLVALLPACVVEHGIPEVSGSVTVAAATPTTGFDTVVVRLSSGPSGELDRQDLAMPASWPLAFDAGGHLGNAKTKHMILDIWLAAGADSQAPAAGAPHVTRDLADCVDTGCTGLALTLAP